MKKKTRGLPKKIIAVMLTVMMSVSVMPQYTFAAGTAQGSTESVDDSVEATVSAEVYFVHSSSKRVITINGTENDPIECVNTITGNSIPENAKFNIYYGEYEGKEIVNFTCNVTNTSWKADHDNIYQIVKWPNPSGWESVVMEPQGDGTIAFKSSANGKYVTVDEFKLKLTDETEISGNEKFVVHTTTKPKTAKKVTLSEVYGDSVQVSWEGVSQCVYSGYQVLYSKSENGEYKVAGQTADTTYTVEGLELNTKYYFKVRTVTNNEDGVYADSAVAYTTTLNDYKPAIPKDITLTRDEDNKMKLEWKAAKSAKSYEIYRAASRFGEYKKIAEVSGKINYIDKNPNASIYSNYYKIKAINDVGKSQFSEPVSLEINMFGNNMYIFAETDSTEEINNVAATIFEKQHYNQFGKERYVMAYKPGDYTATNIVEMGYYTQLLGLGETPYDVSLYNVHTPAALSNNNVTCNFWVSIENVTIADLENNADPYFLFQWAVSQAAPARRLNVERKAQFEWYYDGWASGGYVADSYFQKSSGSWSQQQYYYRNCDLSQGTYGVNWNQVIQGCVGVTADNSLDNSAGFTNMKELISKEGTTNCGERGCTTIINTTEEIREKPFLYFDKNADEYKVFIPAMRKNAIGTSWKKNDMGEGLSLSVDKYFYIANPEKDTAETINKQLRLGKNIIFQPGIYHVSEPIKVTKANTVILGLGLATIIPDNGESAIVVDDVGGVSIAGLILDAGNYSDTLLRVGEEGCNKDHSENPTVLQDIFYRVGGTGELGRCGSCQVINSNDVIIDHTWIWRADHGDNTGWNANTAKNGLIVNGDNVTAYGLFCEHFQEYDIIWRGEYGKTYFLQNEKCYDPQNQNEWMSHDGTKKGYAAYKVTNSVKHHYAVGLGVYDVFINTNGASIFLDNAIEVPDTEDVLIENACIVEIANESGPQVGINNIVNDTVAGIRTGAGSGGGFAVQRLLNYCNGVSNSLGDYYEDKTSTEVKTEPGVAPTNDNIAEKDIKKEASSKDDEVPLWNMTEELYDEKIAQGKKEQETNPTVPKDDESDNNNEKDDNKNGNSNSITDNKTDNTTGNQQSAEGVLSKGQKFTKGKFVYKITKVTGKKGTVTLSGVKKKYQKSLKKITIKSKVKYKGYTFKITNIGKKAFAKSKKLKKVTVKGKNLKKISKNAFDKKVRKKISIKAKKKVKKIILKSLKRKK